MANKRSHADWSSLPQTVLVKILQDVPMQSRLLRCALVSTSWAAAAGEACTDITYDLSNNYKAGQLKQFLKWACKRAQQCSSLQLSGAFPDRRRERQPCIPKMRYTQPNLRVLSLHSFTIPEIGPFTTFTPLPLAGPGKVHLKGAKAARQAACQAVGRKAKREAWKAVMLEVELEAQALRDKLCRPAKKIELDWEVAPAPQPKEPAAAQPKKPAAKPQKPAAGQGVLLRPAAPPPPLGPDGPVSAERLTLFDACRHVTNLQLLDCITVIPSKRCKGKIHTLTVLSDLQGLTGLRHLVLDVKGPVAAYKPGVIQQYNNLLPGSIWTGLTQLTHLDLSQQRGVDAECIQGLTHLTALQELRLQASPPTKPQALAPLEHLQALSMLEIHGASSCDFAPDNASFLAALPQLQHVALLQYNSLDARVFSAQLLGQLQHLHLGMRSPIRPAMYVYPGMPFPAADLVTSNGWEPVLAVLADCTALTELRLSHLHDPRSMYPPGMGMLYPQGMELDEADAAARGAVAAAAAAAVAEAAAAFAGLTASTRLQVLHLSDVSLTPGAWAHIFPADHQLPSLRDLTLCNCQQALGSTGFAQLVSCCPGVTALCLDGVLQHNAWVQPLLQLTGLRQLQLLQRVQGDMANLLVQLTGLEGLDTGEGLASMAWSEQQLDQLTRLKRLNFLKGRRDVNLLKAPPRLMPDVLLYLKEDQDYLRELQREREEAEEMRREEDRLLNALVSDEPEGYDMAVDGP